MDPLSIFGAFLIVLVGFTLTGIMLFRYLSRLRAGDNPEKAFDQATGKSLGGDGPISKR